MTTPWPDTSAAELLFLLDASHHVEEELLNRWLEDTAGDHNSPPAKVVLKIGRNPERIDSSALLSVLELSPETRLVPLRVAWISSVDQKDTKPRLRDLLGGNPRRPRPGKARSILKNDPNRARCIAGDSATLAELSSRYSGKVGDVADQTGLADFIAGQAGLALDIAERRLQGGRYKVPRQVAANLRASSKFRTALGRVSEQTGRGLEDLQAESAAIMKELISTPRTFWLDVMERLNLLVISLGYDEDVVVDKQRLEHIRQITREHPAAILWTHKTHVDGFTMQHLFFENDFPAPHTMGGVNMAFAGFGFLARRAGAIFIRRDFKEDLLYKMVLRQYIGYLLEKRFPFSWAFEGTRSRVGKLMPPRYGLLKYVVEAAHATEANNLHIIPAAINYDLIGDVGDYASEQAGATKQPESLKWFIGYLRGLKQPLGRIYVDFGEPVVLPVAPDPEDMLALSKIAFQVGVEANRVTPITLAALTTMVLLGVAPRALTEEELVRELSRLVLWAQERDIRISSDFKPENRGQLGAMADILVSNGLITRYDEGPEIVYAIAPQQHGVANYYRNTTIHFFVTKAIGELALSVIAARDRAGAEDFWREAERLRDLFKFEFFYAPTDQFREELRAEFAGYSADWESGLDQMPGFAVQFLLSFEPLVAHTTLLSFVEAYRVVADVFARLDPADTLDEKACIAQSLAYGRQAYLQRRISSEASIGKVLFQNGFKLLDNLGLVAPGDETQRDRRRAMAQEFRELAINLERVRAAALPLS